MNSKLIIVTQAKVRALGPGEAVHSKAIPGEGGAPVPVEEDGGRRQPQHLGPDRLRSAVPVRVDIPGPQLGGTEMLGQV